YGIEFQDCLVELPEGVVTLADPVLCVVRKTARWMFPQKFFENKIFQCWQLTNCPEKIRSKCPAYLNYEYRFWEVTKCFLDEIKQEKAFTILNNVIELEDA
ncbi:MAG: hypothetical protein ACFFG0_07355, partial [Candidatus Thorarchaeota archaeon]